LDRLERIEMVLSTMCINAATSDEARARCVQR
jgi:hypothetical protein